MKTLMLSGFLSLFLISALTSCGGPPPTATPDIPATVQSEVAKALPATPTAERDVPPTVEPKVETDTATDPTATSIADPTVTPRPTDTVYPTPTYTIAPTPPTTAAVKPTPISRPTPTPTPTSLPIRTPRPTNTPRPTPTPLPPLKYDRSLLLFGPESGVIAHEPGVEFLESFTGVASAKDVVVEATFHNPYSTEDKSWQHGFLLRRARNSVLQWVSIRSDGTWQRFYRLGSTEAHDRRVQQSSAIITAPGGKHTLQVVMIGAEGWVYINGEYQDTLDLSAIDEAGSVRAFIGDYHEGETRFEDFAG